MAAIDSPSKDTQEKVEEKRPRPQLSWWMRLERFFEKKLLNKPGLNDRPQPVY